MQVCAVDEVRAPDAILSDRCGWLRRRVTLASHHVADYNALFSDEDLLGAAPVAQDEIIAQSKTRIVARIRLTARGEDWSDRNRRSDTFILKQEFHHFPFFQSVFTGSRVEREFRNLRFLAERGFPCVRPTAFGIAGLGKFHVRAFLMTEEFAGSVNLKQWSRGQTLGIEQHDVFGALLDLAPQIGALHRDRCYVRTFYAKNILVRRDTRGDGVELALCDIPRLWGARRRSGKTPKLSFYLAAFDLAFLDKWACQVFEPRLREEFLDRYLDTLGEGPSRARWVARIHWLREHLNCRTSLGRAKKGIRKALKSCGLKKYYPF